MINGSKINKAQLARELGVSRAYITMIANGKRKPSRNLIGRIGSLDVNKQHQILNPKSCSSASSDTPP